MGVLELYGPELLSSGLTHLGTDDPAHVPHAFLSDVLEGLREPVVLRHWDDHVASCELCQSNIRAFSAPGARVDAYSAVLNAASRPGVRADSWDDEQWAARLREWLKLGVQEFRLRYKVVAGEANCDIYDDDTLNVIRTVLDHAFEEYGPAGPKFRFVTGPILSVAEGSGPRRSRTIITELAEHPLFELYYSRYRQRLHFRVGARSQRLYCESPHTATNMDREARFVVDGDAPVITLFSQRFERLMSDPFVEVCSDRSTKRFGFMSKVELRELQEQIDRRELVGGIDSLLDSEIFAIADEEGIPYSD